MLHRERPCERCRPLSDRLRRVRTWCRGIFQVKNVFAPVAEPSRTIRDTTARGAEVSRTAGTPSHVVQRCSGPSGILRTRCRGTFHRPEPCCTWCGALPTVPKAIAPGAEQSRRSPRPLHHVHLHEKWLPSPGMQVKSDSTGYAWQPHRVRGDNNAVSLPRTPRRLQAEKSRKVRPADTSIRSQV